MPSQMPFAIYETTASNSGKTTNETHSIGEITGVIERGRTGFAAQYIETDGMGDRGPSVPEFPSKSAGLKFGGDRDTVNPMDTD